MNPENLTIKDEVAFKERIFRGVSPCGIVWADKYKEECGDYKRIAFLSFATLKLEIKDDCPKKLIDFIKSDAKSIQDKKGEEYQISQCGQTITLGYKVI